MATPTRVAPPQQRPGQRRPPMPPQGPRLVDLKHPHRRMRWTLAWFLFFMSIFSARLVDLQVIHGPALAATAENSRMQTATLPALRGMITDVKGVPIATTVMARNITTDQRLIEDPHNTALTLAPILGMDPKRIEKRITGKQAFSYVTKGVTPEKWKQVAELGLPGIFSEPTTTRQYPAGHLAASIVGYVGGEGHGLGGLEYALDKQLGGIDGKQTVERVDGREIPTSEKQSVDAIDGQTVRLTIDRDLQALAERTLAQRIKTAKAEGGDVVVLDPKTGNILAMATSPTFDPNVPYKTDDHAKRNTAVADSFEPGSTGKILTMAAVIEEGKANPLTKFTIPSGLKRGGTVFHDHEEHGTLHLTLNGVLAQSSNMGSILAAEKIGSKKWLSYAKKFGIGSKSGLHFPGEAAGILPDPKSESQWSGTTFPTLAFGQGYSVTALQVASVYATIANDGVRMTPRLVAGYTNPDGTESQAAASEGTRVVSATTAKTVREMLESVVGPQGTAPDAKIPGYRVAGKTGTANRFSDETGGYSGFTASFVGFAPAENPSLVIAVMIHNPKKGHWGSTVAAPVWRTVMTYALAQQKVPPSTTKPPKMRVKW